MAVASQKCILLRNFQLPSPLKFGCSVFQVLTEMENWCWPLWKMGKMVVAPQTCVLEQNFQLPTPLKFGSPVFRVLTEMENWCQPLWKMGKMSIASQNTSWTKLPITEPPKDWVSSFLNLRKWKIGVGHYRKWEKWP